MAQGGKMSKYRQIGFLMDAGEDVNPDEYEKNEDRLNNLLQNGVIYKDKKKKFWVDQQDCTCFTIYPRGLNITNGDRPIYWKWAPTGSYGVEEATAIRARWLEVKGSFWTMDLTPEKLYKVSFRTRMDPPGRNVSTMGQQMVNLRLTLPDGNNQETQSALPTNGTSSELEVGRFTVTTHNVGKMEFSMKKSFEAWMGGLVIEGVEIKGAA